MTFGKKVCMIKITIEYKIIRRQQEYEKGDKCIS